MHKRLLVAVVTLAACASAPRAAPTTTVPTTTTSSATTTTTPATTTTTTPATTTTTTVPQRTSDRLAAAYTTILDVERPTVDRAAAGRTLQRLIRGLTLDEQRVAEIAAELSQRFAPLALNDLTAALAPAQLPQSTPLMELPAWRIREPLPAATLLSFYRSASTESGISWGTLAAINLVETRMGRIIGASSSGAVGPMQFLPTTWAVCCQGDPWDDHDAIHGAAAYLVRRGGPGDMRRAILGYNPSEPYLAMVTAYADNLAREPDLLVGYHAWEVYVRTVSGAVRLSVGYDATEPIDAAEYYRAHPGDHAD